MASTAGALVEGEVTTVHYVPGTVHCEIHCSMYSANHAVLGVKCAVFSVYCAL